MAPIAVGETIPNRNLTYLDDSQTKQDVSLHSLAGGKLVVIVAVPGAYTPTCRFPFFYFSSRLLCLCHVGPLFEVGRHYTT